MKSSVRITLIAVLAALSTSCNLSKVEWVKFEDFSDLDEQTSFIPYRTEANLLDGSTLGSMSLPGNISVDECLENEEASTKTTSTNGANLLRGLLSAWKSKQIRSYCGTYYSTDQHGNRIKLSGRIILPADGKVSRIMLVSHFTIGANVEAPSSELPLEAIYAAHGVAVVESDYVGYGASVNMIHPYLCAEVTANNVIDMYYASLPFLEKIGCSPENDDIFLLGFSQGGAVTMSVAQELEKNHPWVDIRLTMCGGGPYDICATYDTLINNDVTDYPCAIPMIIQGLNDGMDLGLDYNEFFLPKMVDNMDEWLNSKKYPMADITRMIGSNRISSIMTEDARNKVNPRMTELYRAMIDNSAVWAFAPSCPIYLYHSLDDNVVPFVNADSMSYVLKDSNVIYNFGHYGNHQISTLRFFMCCIDLLKSYGDIY